MSLGFNSSQSDYEPLWFHITSENRRKWVRGKRRTFGREYLLISLSSLFKLRNDRPHFESVRATACVKREKWYYETLLLSSGIMQIGWATSRCRFSPEEGYGVGDDCVEYQPEKQIEFLSWYWHFFGRMDLHSTPIEQLFGPMGLLCILKVK